MRINAEVVLKSFPNIDTKDGEPTNFESPTLPDPESLSYEFNFQVWSKGERLLARASTTPTEALNPTFIQGFSSRVINGRLWRVYALSDTRGEIQVHVGQTVEHRIAIATAEIYMGLKALLWLIGPLTLCLFAMSLWTAQPVRRLLDSVAKRSPEDDGPLPEAGLPSEVVPLVKTFNDLLKRSAEARDVQQRFLGDAAHELRTPLAVLRVQARIAQRAQDDTQRTAALARLMEGIDRATRVTEQLLELARMDGMPASDPAVRAHTVDIGSLVARGLAGCHNIAERRRVQVQVHIEVWMKTVIAKGDGELLGIALRNVLDNAVRYSPSGSAVEVRMSQQADVIHLIVEDSGAGLNADQKQQAMQPFVRLGANEEIGSGLGLSIVQRICTLQQVHFELLDLPSGRGLQARFTLAAAETSA